jgi:hypothetical protein
LGRCDVVIVSCSCTGFAEAFIAHFEQISCGLQVGPPRKDDPCPVESLESVDQRGSVGFGKDVVANLEHVIGAETEEVAIERCMMERAQGDSVLDEWFSGGVRVGDNVGRVKKFLVTEPTERTLALVRLEYPFAKPSLVESKADHRRRVESTRGVGVFMELIDRVGRLQADMDCIVDSHGERETARLVGHDEDRPGSEVAPGDDSMEIDKREATFHRKTETSVIGVLRVGAAVPIPKQPIGTERVVVRTRWRSGD